MSKTIQAIRGMNDILPPETPSWQHLERVVLGVLEAYGYDEIRLPLLERTELFSRSIGEVTDIVEKEMYTFADRNGDSLTLRPEGTAGCVRAAIQHALVRGQQRLWYQGPMFRHERPQKGRYRQFHQVGVEVMGLAGPDVDAELILMTRRMWRELGLAGLTLELNSLGTPEARRVYRESLVAYLRSREDELDEDSRRRLDTNPLRILDSKNPAMADVIAGAPRLTDHLDPASREHFDGLRVLLDAAGVSYTLNPLLVRGLDYYSRTVFEWTSTSLGAQGTVCAGGRYDGLVEQLGGRGVPAVGFALGLERLVALMDQAGVTPTHHIPHAYLVMVGEAAATRGVVLAEAWRDAVPGLRLRVHCGGGGFKSQLKKADASGARLALVLGEDELAAGRVGVKDLRGNAPQEQLALADVPERLRGLAGSPPEGVGVAKAAPEAAD